MKPGQLWLRYFCLSIIFAMHRNHRGPQSLASLTRFNVTSFPIAGLSVAIILRMQACKADLPSGVWGKPMMRSVGSFPGRFVPEPSHKRVSDTSVERPR